MNERIVTEAEIRDLALSLCYARHPEPVAEAEIRALIEWAEAVRMKAAALDNLLNFDMLCAGMKDGEPLLMLSPKGTAAVEAMIAGVKPEQPGEEGPCSS